MIPLQDRFLAGLFILSIGILFRHAIKLREADAAEEIEEYRREFRMNSKRLMLWDFIYGVFGSTSPRIVNLIISPLLPWFFIILGAVQMADAVILLYWPNP